MNKNVNKIMKTSNLKNIVVYLTEDDVSEFEVDTNDFSDPFLEAATRAVEKSKKQQGGIIRPVTRCWEKNTPKKIKTYNSYFILVNAGFYNKAELLREKFKMQTDIDLAKEPTHDVGRKS
jgi:hypothetical protein